MTIQECYAALGADYEGTLHRLSMDALVHKFALYFLEDDSFATLSAAMEAQDYEVAFRASHTLKGVCLNLGFTKLHEASSDLTEAMRDGKKLEDMSLYEKVREEYNRTVEMIKALDLFVCLGRRDYMK